MQDLVGIGQFAGAELDVLLSLTIWLASTLQSKGTEDARMADRGQLAWAPLELSTERVVFDTSSRRWAWQKEQQAAQPAPGKMRKAAGHHRSWRCRFSLSCAVAMAWKGRRPHLGRGARPQCLHWSKGRLAGRAWSVSARHTAGMFAWKETQ